MTLVFFFLAFQTLSSNKFLFAWIYQRRFCYMKSQNLNRHNNWLLYLQRCDPMVFKEIQLSLHGSILCLIGIYSLSFFPSLPCSVSPLFLLSTILSVNPVSSQQVKSGKTHQFHRICMLGGQVWGNDLYNVVYVNLQTRKWNQNKQVTYIKS